MKKLYITPEMEVVTFSLSDVLSGSDYEKVIPTDGNIEPTLPDGTLPGGGLELPDL